jgi:predicted O-linked N-acetylglucosamine transferase (SPINDLY family)
MDARLLLKGPGFDDRATIERLCGQFERAGIDRARLILEGPSPPQQFLATYQRIDVALDPTAYSGGLTTMEALWMGVPVVSLPGSRFTSRHSATHLSAIGLDDWIVADPDAYIARALDAVADPHALSSLRAGLRERMARSPLCDGRALAAQIETLCRQLWRQIVLV